MPSPLRFRAAALGLGFILAAWSTAPGCGSGGGNTTTTTSSGTTGTGGSGTGGSTGSTGGMTGTGGSTFADCTSCLDTSCAAEETACTSDCHAIQACLDAVCVHLSETMSADEGACQVHCQMLHPAGKAAHLALVNCAHSTSCIPPCEFYSHDYDVCVMAESAGECKPALDTCNGDADCLAYQSCASACTTLADCLACGAGASATAGEKLYEDAQLCIEQKCIAQGWLPSF